jgi:hypothetical protein
VAKKPKPATAGKRIAKWTHTWHPLAFKSAMLDAKLARRIDAAIRRAVKKERDRCTHIAKQAFNGDIDVSDAWLMIVNGREP